MAVSSVFASAPSFNTTDALSAESLKTEWWVPLGGASEFHGWSLDDG